MLEHLASIEPRPLAIAVSGSKTWAVAEESVMRFRPIAFLDKRSFDIAEFTALVQETLTALEA